MDPANEIFMQSTRLSTRSATPEQPLSLVTPGKKLEGEPRKHDLKEQVAPYTIEAINRDVVVLWLELGKQFSTGYNRSFEVAFALPKQGANKSDTKPYTVTWTPRGSQEPVQFQYYVTNRFYWDAMERWTSLKFTSMKKLEYPRQKVWTLMLSS